jgi:SAM-dependent methyltransferase
MMEAFKTIYEKNLWKNAETHSGKGSTLEFTRPLRLVLPAILEKLGTKTLLDAGCGDFNWMKEVNLGKIKYIGCDVVEAMVAEDVLQYKKVRRTFIHRDITTDALPRADTIICRCCLYHLSNANVAKALDNFKFSRATWLLATTHPHVEVNVDIPDGKWRRLNLENILGPAMEKIPDGPGDDGYLGIWKLKEE